MRNPAKDISTDDLEKALGEVKADGLSAYFAEYEESMALGTRPFTDYMNERLKERNLKKQALFLSADLPEKYGYKLLSEEKHTAKRDVYLRLFYAAKLNLREAQRALRLVGQEELYIRIKRDAVLMLGFRDKLGVDEMNELLIRNGFEPLERCGQNE